MSELPLKSLPPMSLSTLAFSKSLNERLKADTRIPNGVIRYSVQDKEDGSYHIDIVKCDLDLEEELFQQYSSIAVEIFEAMKN